MSATYISRNTDCESATPRQIEPAASASRQSAPQPASDSGSSTMPKRGAVTEGALGRQLPAERLGEPHVLGALVVELRRDADRAAAAAPASSSPAPRCPSRRRAAPGSDRAGARRYPRWRPSGSRTRPSEPTIASGTAASVPAARTRAPRASSASARLRRHHRRPAARHERADVLDRLRARVSHAVGSLVPVQSNSSRKRERPGASRWRRG